MDPRTEERLKAALQQWVSVRHEQMVKSQAGGNAQEGSRSAVTGGAHLDGLNRLVLDEIEATGAAGLEIRTHRKATLPGFYRPTKAWDLLVLQQGSPVLVVEYKSMNGSEGRNLNNRADEIFGMAEDLRQAELNGLLPKNLRRAYVFVMGLTPESLSPRKSPTAFGGADPLFAGRSYFERAAIMCQRMRDSGLFHMTWAIGVKEDPLKWHEPLAGVGWERFAADLREAFSGGHPAPPHVP
ncbi:PaeR7I family type II restriction endonuclease [Spirillospora albida]|uniref:PaeR7I family type II restriction endonuclease n=1 Tax=Spirillospora albida TaxID=58123 RepID=UPI0004C0836A|nr:PaeR7I family type II restriction endonuclease [Spirillospora albida]